MFFRSSFITISLLSFTLAGCSVVYDSQRLSSLKSCEKLVNMEEMKACYQQPQPQFDQYDKQREVLQSGQSEQQTPAKQKPAGSCFKRAATGEIVCPN